MAMTGITIDEATKFLNLPPGTYLATTRDDWPTLVMVSNHMTGRIVASICVHDAAAWCRAFNARRLGSGWWAGRVVNSTNGEEEGNER